MKILVISAYRGIGDLIFHLPLFRYLSKKFKDKVLNVLQKNSLIFHQDKLISKHRSAQINKGHVIENIEWKDSIGHYGSLSEIVHPTAFFMVDKLSTFDPMTVKDIAIL